MRTAFSDALVAAASHDPTVFLLTGDHGYALFDPFRKAFPDRYLNCGVAEQNMIGVAAGLAKSGLVPIVYGLAAFVPVRVLEQIKIDVCYEGLKVIFAGDGAGVVYAQLGASHQSTEDIAVLRALPNLTIYSPSDRFELTACMRQLLQGSSAGYLRMGKADLGDVHSQELMPEAMCGLIELGAGGRRHLFVATGSGVKLAQQVAKAVGDSTVVSAPCLKPFSSEALRAMATGYESVVTFEEHTIHGGLGGVVAETLLGNFSGRFLRIGIRDRFTPLCGSYQFVMREHGLDAETVTEQIRAFLRLPAADHRAVVAAEGGGRT